MLHWLSCCVIVLALLANPAATVAGECQDLPQCHGCGCRGGPGFRGPDGRCVGYRDLSRVCGPDPGKACTFENAPNTGLNRGCRVRPQTDGGTPAG